MQQEVPAEKFLADLSSQLRLVRHVRIVVKDAAGAPLACARRRRGGRGAGRRAPTWFAALIAPPSASRDVPVIVKGGRIGTVEIVAEPRDEIAEAWGNTVALGDRGACRERRRRRHALCAVRAGARPAHRRRPRPRRSRAAQLPGAAAAAAAAGARRHHRPLQCAGAGARGRACRERTAQSSADHARRTTNGSAPALELHDEVGPSLFGLKANAASIATAAAATARSGRTQADRARARHAWRSSSTCRRSTAACSTGCVRWRSATCRCRICSPSWCSERARQQPQIAFSFSAPTKLMRSYGDCDRPHGLSLRAGKPDQCHPACAGEATSSVELAATGGDADGRRHGGASTLALTRARRRSRDRSRGAAGFRHARHAGTRASARRQL